MGKRLGAELLGASLYELEPRQKTFPYHWHYAQEEWLIVVTGTPTLRDPRCERRLAPGDCIVFRRGPGGAHLVRNDTDEPCRVLVLSSPSDVEIAVYPDSRKVGAFGKAFGEGGEPFRLLVRAESGVDYFEGEE